MLLASPSPRRSTAAACLLLLGALAPNASAKLDAPVTPNAIPEVASLMAYLQSVSGSKILSGQQEIAWDNNRVEEDINYIVQQTGKKPVVRGFDFLNYLYSPSVRSTQTATERAIQWARGGGIVTFCSHFFVDLGSPAGNPQFYTPGASGAVGTTFDIRQALIAGTPENTEVLAKMDIMAGELKKLRDAGVPVLWRPFHECSGNWFWWGAKGPAPFIQLYRMMFDRYTRIHGLTNLIWVFNPTDSAASMQAWYPGDDVVDMISLDVYPAAGTHPAYAAESRQMRDFRAGRKLVGLSENGSIPDPDKLSTDGAVWSYFCTWNGFVNDVTRNSVAFLKTVFTHPDVLTLDEVPDVYRQTVDQPSVVVAPNGAAAAAGMSVTLAVLAAGPGPLAYQWRRNGTDVAGATRPELTLANLQPGDAGNYVVVVTGPGGSVTTAPVAVTVDPTPAPRQAATLLAISTRGVVGTGENVLIAGVVVTGTGSKKILIRAVGPTLLSRGVTTALADTRLELTRLDGTLIATNDDWGLSERRAEIAAAAAASYAAPLPEGSRDSALLVTLPPGAYTAIVRGAGDATGVALVEVYEVP